MKKGAGAKGDYNGEKKKAVALQRSIIAENVSHIPI